MGVLQRRREGLRTPRYTARATPPHPLRISSLRLGAIWAPAWRSMGSPGSGSKSARRVARKSVPESASKVSSIVGPHGVDEGGRESRPDIWRGEGARNCVAGFGASQGVFEVAEPDPKRIRQGRWAASARDDARIRLLRHLGKRRLQRFSPKSELCKAGSGRASGPCSRARPSARIRPPASAQPKNQMPLLAPPS